MPGPLKLQVVGPWTLAANVWLSRGERVIVDEGACRDLVESLAEGVRLHVAAVRSLVPGAEVVLQVDEPSPPDRAGRPAPDLVGLRAAAEPRPAGGRGRTHDGARRPRRGHGRALLCGRARRSPLLRATGPTALSLDTSLLRPREWEGVAVAVEDGIRLHAGVGAHGRRPHPPPGPLRRPSWRPGPEPACRCARSPMSSSRPHAVWPPRRPTWREQCSAPRSRPPASSRSAASSDAAPGASPGTREAGHQQVTGLVRR